MDFMLAMLFLTAIFTGGAFGGSIPAILMNIPGTSSAIATTFDGYPMSRRGEHNVALGVALGASCVGVIVGYTILFLLISPISELVLKVGPAEMTAVSLWGVMLIGALSSERLLKGVISGLAGLLIATIGFSEAGVARGTFGSAYLVDGIPGTLSRWGGGEFLREIFMSPLGIPCTPPPWGTLSAIDMDSGKLVWQIPLGQIKRFGITVPKSFGWGSPNVGGPILTAGGLIFVAATLDEKIRALDIETGDELWQADLPITATAMPMTYRGEDGRQYVVIAAGGTGRIGTGSSDHLIAFALPE